MPSENKSDPRQLFWLLAAGVALEALYLRMHSLYYLKNHAIGFIELALAAGTVYLILLYALGRTRASRAAFILLIFGAIVFRATLWPMLPTLSDDLQRYRWDAQLQANGWNPYAVAPNDPRLARHMNGSVSWMDRQLMRVLPVRAAAMIMVARLWPRLERGSRARCGLCCGARCKARG